MIYGIKQIEKQFPGFEARWCDGVVFDVRDVFENQDDYLMKLLVDIQEEYWDMIELPSNKSYFIIGNRAVSGSYVEIAVEKPIDKLKDDNKEWGEKNGTQFWNIIHHSRFHKHNASMALRLPPCTIYKGNVRYLSPGPGYDFKKWQKYVCGNVSKYPSSMEETKAVVDEILHVALGRIVLSAFYLNIRNIKPKASYVPQLRDYYYPKAWGREYKVLSLSQTLTEHSTGPDLPPGYHVRGHFQRGHFKRKLHGVYWWNPHWRGDFSKGIVMKDYKAKGDKDA